MTKSILVLFLILVLTLGTVTPHSSFADSDDDDPNIKFKKHKVHTGDGPPPPKMGKVGDLYIDSSDTNNLVIYKKTAKNTWTNLGSFQGPPGPPGNNGAPGPPGTIQAQSCPPGQFVTGFNGLGQVICSSMSSTPNGVDLAVANGGSNIVSILLGTGTGTFGGATNFDVGAGPVSVAVGDFNGDGKQDLAVANGGFYTIDSNTVSILLGTGTGTFGGATNFAVGAGPFSVAVGQFN